MDIDDGFSEGFKAFDSKAFNWTQLENDVPALNKLATDPKDSDPILTKAYDKARFEFAVCMFKREMVSHYMDTGTVPFKNISEVHQVMIDNQYHRNSTKSPFYFLTINPRPGVYFGDFTKVVEKVLSKKTITHYAYAYEVRKYEDGIPSGIHCHILLEQTLKPHDFKKGVKSTCKHICDSNNPNVLNFKNIEPDSILQKLEYLAGDKKDSKLQSVADTILWRNENMPIIQPLYESNPSISCRVTQTQPLIEEA